MQGSRVDGREVDGLTRAPAAIVSEAAVDVLLVEDDAGDALLVEEYLADSGLTTRLRWVRSLSDALNLVTDQLDCVLLDLHLPDGDGLDALHRILAVAPQAAVLVLTGLTDLDVAVQAVTAGAQDYLLKGQVDGQVLARAIRYSVQRKQAEQAARALHESQLRAAENTRLERGLLPVPMVEDPRVSLVSRYRSGRQGALLGGDFYDAVQRPDGTLSAVVGDVSGHGPDEAALGVALRIAWRTLVLAGVSDPELLSLLEQVLVAERAGPEIFATLCHLSTDIEGGTLRLLCAGHPPPLLLVGGTVRVLPVSPTPPLGVRPGGGAPESWRLDEIRRPAGGSLLMYTDGLIDAHSDAGSSRFGVEGLSALIATVIGRPTASSPLRLVDAVVSAVQAADRGRSEDDIAVVHLSWADR
jgi:serine phosphatase RsbU (regulator of sigma subunit)